jgi:FkbM family methyltransferase
MPGVAGFDPILLTIADRYVNDTSVVWDIGANVGVFTFAAAARCPLGRVVAFEPDAFLVACLRRSLAYCENCDLRVDVVPVAISERDGIARLFVAERGRSMNTIDASFAAQYGAREETIVATLRLDTALDHFLAPSFVKIDVERAENLVLRGADRLLRDARPVLFIEVSREPNEVEVRTLLHKHNYVLFDGENLQPDAKPSEVCHGLTLAKPAELAS